MAKPRKGDPKKIVRQLTPEKDLNKLLANCRSASKQMGEIGGSLREKIAYAKDKKHLHTKAFSVARSLDKMEPDALAAFFDHFDHYCDVSGLRERAESAPGLDLEDKEDDKDEGEDSPRRPRVVAGTDGQAAVAGGTPG